MEAGCCLSPADTAAATCFPSQMQRHLQVHGAGSFGHFQASQYGVARGGHDPAAAVRGFVETRRSVTQLNHAVVSALVDAGVPAVGLSPCGTWSCSGRQLQDASPGIAAVQAALQHGLVSSVGMTTSPCAAVHTCYTYSCAQQSPGAQLQPHQSKLRLLLQLLQYTLRMASAVPHPQHCACVTLPACLSRHLPCRCCPPLLPCPHASRHHHHQLHIALPQQVPVLHGDCVFDATLGVTILSGDTILRALAAALRPAYCVFLADVAGLLTQPPQQPGARLIPAVEVAADGSWSVAAAAAAASPEAGGSSAAGNDSSSSSKTSMAVQLTAAAHDTTGGIAAKVEEAAGVVLGGCPVVIAQAGTASGAAAVLHGPNSFAASSGGSSSGAAAGGEALQGTVIRLTAAAAAGKGGNQANV